MLPSNIPLSHRVSTTLANSRNSSENKAVENRESSALSRSSRFMVRNSDKSEVMKILHISCAFSDFSFGKLESEALAVVALGGTADGFCCALPRSGAALEQAACKDVSRAFVKSFDVFARTEVGFGSRSRVVAVAVVASDLMLSEESRADFGACSDFLLIVSEVA